MRVINISMKRRQRYPGWFAILASIFLIFTGNSCFASNNANINSDATDLHVHGALVVGACQLDMQSAYQEIDIQGTTTGNLLNLGDFGPATALTIQMSDCQAIGGHSVSPATNVSTWDDKRPVVTVSFMAAVDSDNPDLIKVNGITGMGLLLKDSNGRKISLGKKDKPQFISPGSNALGYTVTAVRTSAPLTTGSFRAVIDFWVSYD